MKKNYTFIYSLSYSFVQSGSRRLETFPDPFENFFGRRPRLAIGGHEPGFGQHLAPFGMMDPFERMNTMMRDMVS